MPSDSDRLFKVVAEELGVELNRVTADRRLESLGADSLNVVELSFGIEEEFDVAIPDDDLIGWVIVADIAKSLAELLPRPEEP